MTNFALIGRARSGKDTIAARLVSRRQYVPLAFATPLKTAAEHLNPIIHGGMVPVRLNDALAEFGWEGAKDAYPEVRRILQHMGQGVRELDPDFWAMQLLRKVREHQRFGARIVVTDVRYPNEADMLRLNGFVLVRVIRPSLAGGPFAQHVSETALDHYPTDQTLFNSGTREDLWNNVDKLVDILG